MMTDADSPGYDEFGFLESYARHEGLPWCGLPEVRRRTVGTSTGFRVSGLVWGSDDEAQIVLLHGAGQNAHTWDSVALALNRPLVALDLPGHGHSDWREDGDYRPTAIARILSEAIPELAPRASVFVGMSLGGLALIRLSAEDPGLMRHVVLVDVTPGIATRAYTTAGAGRGTTVLLRAAPRYESFDAMVAAVAAVRPGRPAESLRPGVMHNSRQLPDGTWAWRYDPRVTPGARTPMPQDEPSALWDRLRAMTASVVLVRGALSPYVHDDDQAEFARRRPGARIEVVAGAAHSVQSDRPIELATLIASIPTR